MAGSLQVGPIVPASWGPHPMSPAPPDMAKVMGCHIWTELHYVRLPPAIPLAPEIPLAGRWGTPMVRSCGRPAADGL